MKPPKIRSSTVPTGRSVRTSIPSRQASPSDGRPATPRPGAKQDGGKEGIGFPSVRAWSSPRARHRRAMTR